MFEIRLNTRKNAILCVLPGRLDFREAERYVRRFKEAVRQLRPGYTVIADLSEYSPAQEDARALLQEAIEFSVAHESGRMIRIVGDSVGAQVGNLQFNRAARREGYEVIVVASFEEAQRLLG